MAGATFAFFSADTGTQSNTFTAGTLSVQLTDENGTLLSTPIMEYYGMAPGDTRTYYADVKATGSLAMIYQWVFERQSTSGSPGRPNAGTALAQALQLRIEKRVGPGPNDWQRWGDVQAYNSGVIRERTLFEWWDLARPDYQDHLNSGDSHQFRFIATLPLSTGDGVQGGTAIIRLNVNASQEANVGLNARYFANETLSGTPLMTRIDPTINYDWSRTRPHPGLPQNNWSVEWEGYVIPNFTELYTFYGRTDDGMRIWIDDVLVFDHWTAQAAQEWPSAPVSLTAGHKHKIKVQWYERTGEAVAQMKWSSASTPKAIVPQTALWQQ